MTRRHASIALSLAGSCCVGFAIAAAFAGPMAAAWTALGAAAILAYASDVTGR